MQSTATNAVNQNQRDGTNDGAATVSIERGNALERASAPGGRHANARAPLDLFLAFPEHHGRRLAAAAPLPALGTDAGAALGALDVRDGVVLGAKALGLADLVLIVAQRVADLGQVAHVRRHHHAAAGVDEARGRGEHWCAAAQLAPRCSRRHRRRHLVGPRRRAPGRGGRRHAAGRAGRPPVLLSLMALTGQEAGRQDDDYHHHDLEDCHAYPPKLEGDGTDNFAQS